MDRVTDVVTVVVLLIVALVTSKLAAGIREQARIAAAHAARNATIAGFAGRLLSSSSEEEIARPHAANFNRLFDCNAMLVSGLPQPRRARGRTRRQSPHAERYRCSRLDSGIGRIGGPRDTAAPAGRVAVPPDPLRTIRSSLPPDFARDDGSPPVDEDQLPLLAQPARSGGAGARASASGERTAARSAPCASVTAYARRSCRRLVTI